MDTFVFTGYHHHYHLCICLSSWCGDCVPDWMWKITAHTVKSAVFNMFVGFNGWTRATSLARQTPLPAEPSHQHCFFLLSLHEEIKQIHILTNNREENYNQRQKITHRIRRIMEVCLQFNCYTHCIILGVTCALHKHKKPWNMENKYLCGDLRRIFLSHIYTNRIPQVLEHRFTQKRMMKCREYRIN